MTLSVLSSNPLAANIHFTRTKLFTNDQLSRVVCHAQLRCLLFTTIV